jgi:nitroreductase
MSRAARVLSLGRNRQGVRRFQDRAVRADLLECVLEAARYAPSAKEAQPWRFVVVQDALRRHQVARAAFNHPLVLSAPVLILCCARIHSHVSGNGRVSYPIDVAAAAQSMSLAAADVGLGVGWIMGFREGEVRKLTEVPSDVPILTILTLGYPESFQPLAARRAAEEVFAWERWKTGTAAPDRQ